MNAEIRTTCLALVLTLWSAVTRAEPVTLDTTFGSGGEAMYAFGISTAVAPMPDGRLLMYDTNAVSGGQVRLRTRLLSPDGQPVPGWGVGGELVINFNFAPYLQTVWTAGDFRLAGTADGAVVGILHLGNSGSNPPYATTITLVRAIRLRADGTYDATYAALSPANLEDTRNGDLVHYMPPIAQPDGSVLIAHGCSDCDEYNFYTGLQRLRADGSAATFYSFNTPPFAKGTLHDARVLADGKVIVANEYGATRYNADGSVDTNYGTGGYFSPVNGASSAFGFRIYSMDLWHVDAAIDSAGNVTFLVMAEQHLNIGPFFLLRADNSGRPDSRFGYAGNGIAPLPWLSGQWGGAVLGNYGIFLAPNGNTVVSLSEAASNEAWWVDASGRQHAMGPLPDFQILPQDPNVQRRYEVLSANNDGSIYMLTSRSVIRLSGNPDTTSPGLLLAPNQISVDEESFSGTGTLTIPVVRVAGSRGRISVDYATGASAALSATGPVAAAGIDYDAASGRLEWADGEQGTKYIQLNVHNDSLPETWERFEISFSNVVGAPLLSPAAITITIPGNDVVVTPPAPSPSPTPSPNPSPTPAPTPGGGGAMDLWTLLLLAGCALPLLQRRHFRAKVTSTACI